MTAEQDPKAGVLPESGITIPAYYVDYGVGVNLYHQLEKMAGVPTHNIPTFDNVNLTTRISVCVSLIPADNVKPCAWELTLLVMLVLLGTTVFFSVLMHIYMWKKNQRLQSVVERHRNQASGADSTSRMGKAFITISRLYQFPTRIIDTLPDEEEREKVETVLSDEKQREALIKTTTLSSNNNKNGNQSLKQNKASSIFMKNKLKPSSATTTPSTSTAVKTDAPVSNMCVICLEAFKIGDEVRELPCHHEFHCRTCTDPWLTGKSGECPLRRFDCSSSDNLSVKTLKEEDYTNAPGIRGKYLRFKENRKNRATRRIGQVACGCFWDVI